MVSVHSHCTRIREVVHSSPAACSHVPSYITDSWIRCSNEYQLDPTLPGELCVVDRHELLTRQEQLSAVLRAAKSEMATLFQQIAKAGYAIMLTDCEGVLLNYFGDPGFTHAASKSGLVPGAVWSERYQGTNGMGTCLLEQRPMMVHQDDHYLFRNTGLTCAAAPIFDYRPHRGREDLHRLRPGTPGLPEGLQRAVRPDRPTPAGIDPGEGGWSLSEVAVTARQSPGTHSRRLGARYPDSGRSTHSARNPGRPV